MPFVKTDSAGDLRCWYCGGKNFQSKRTFAAKAMIGVGALLTKKKLKCLTCGKYNRTGHAQPYTKPASPVWRKRAEKALAAQVPTQPAEVELVAPRAEAGPAPVEAETAKETIKKRYRVTLPGWPPH